MSELKQAATLRDLQDYTWAHYKERGFDNTMVQECLLLTEEVGELAKAIRKDKRLSGMKIDSGSDVREIAHELADILWVTTTIANMAGVDLEQALREKEVINHGRRWE